jgi:phytoene synthase
MATAPARDGFASPADHTACRLAIQQGSKSFFAASLLLPSSVREPAFGLYAFCRLSDDAIDIDGGSLPVLERLRERLQRAYEGRPLPLPADRAMADIVRRFAIPHALPAALLEGLAWDAEGRRYQSLADLFDYAARVAGSVGVMMTLMMGERSSEALARAADLGIAMQLTNIARDVGEDARAGRLYLPLAWLSDVGIAPESFLAAPRLSAPLQGVIARLLAESEQLYRRASQGIAHLPMACRPAIFAAALLYAEIGRSLARAKHDSISHRTRVGTPRKIQLLTQAALAAPLLRQAPPEPALAATAFLLAAVPPSRSAVPVTPSHTTTQGRHLRVLAIFDRLDRAAQFGK